MTKDQVSKKAVLFISNVPSPYNVDYLNELGKLRPVEAVFEKGHSSERDTSWKSFCVHAFNCHILKGISTSVDGAFSPGVVRYIHRYRKDHILIGNPSTPTGILAILYCKLFRIPFILQSEGGIPKDGKGIKEKIKYFLMHDAKLYLSGMSLKNEYFLTYGADASRHRQYPFTSLFQRDIVERMITDEEKTGLRKELGIEASKVFLYVGQFIHRKGVDVLLRASAGLPEDTLVIAVGGEPTEEYRKLAEERKLDNIRYVKFADKETVKKYYRAADVFVLPTREDTWGLVVNEAMAAGLPVITTKACVAGNELIEDEKNGYLLDPEDWEALHQKMVYLAQNPDISLKMGEESLKRIQPYSLENMAQTIDKALQ